MSRWHDSSVGEGLGCALALVGVAILVAVLKWVSTW